LDFGGKAITVHSENGPESCTIDCEGSGRGFHFYSGEGPGAVAAGFTITGGSTVDDGGGIRCDGSSPTIVNCMIAGNTVSYPAAGGGIACAVESDPTITNCTISGNTATGSSGGGIFCWSNSDPTFTNCTISGNTADAFGGGLDCWDSSPMFINCILWGDLPDEINVNSGSPVADYSDIENGTGEPWFGPGCIEVGPLFANPGSGDYGLQPGSPCIDAADNTTVPPD
ncbi:MAG: right-handed parallel beta-helix repeat-containing protein, partial [bacterium]|nr:right-handed parallel beta-helix repeat-containing protein [bacterium]